MKSRVLCALVSAKRAIRSMGGLECNPYLWPDSASHARIAFSREGTQAYRLHHARRALEIARNASRCRSHFGHGGASMLALVLAQSALQEMQTQRAIPARCPICEEPWPAHR